MMKGNPVSQKLVPKTLARIGVITRSPLLWALATAVMATAGGPRGKQAALRGSVCYLLGLGAGNLPKPLFGRAQSRSPSATKAPGRKGCVPLRSCCSGGSLRIWSVAGGSRCFLTARNDGDACALIACQIRKTLYK
jgi:hypothetical protein